MSRGAATYGDFDVVNEQMPRPGEGATQSHPAKVYSGMARNWPRVFLVGSLIVVVLTFVAIILNFIQVAIKPATTMLNIYCLIFSLLAFTTEMRQFKWCRRITYIWLRYIYFLAYYKSRGLFYIFFGMLLMGELAIMYVAGAVAIIVGLIMLITSVFADLPVYDDPQEERRIQEEYITYLQTKSVPAAGAGIGAKIGHAFDNVTNKLAHKGKSDQGEGTAGGAQQEANTGDYQAPPVATTAQGSTAAFKESDEPYEDGSANASAVSRPPRRESSSGAYSPREFHASDNAFSASGANMFGSSAHTSTVARPLQEDGIVRGVGSTEATETAGTGESELRRAFNAGMSDPAVDLR